MRGRRFDRWFLLALNALCVLFVCVVQWKNNMRHGMGSSIEPDGTIYHGEVRLIRRVFLSAPF